MVSNERLLEMFREGVRLEERTVLFHLEGSINELKNLQLTPETEKSIRECLDHLRTDTIEHNELFKKAMMELSR